MCKGFLDQAFRGALAWAPFALESGPVVVAPRTHAVSGLAGVLVFWALTASGDANSWYADGTLAASRSWKAFFYNSADLSGVVSLDKGPLSDWMMGLSGRIFGFSSFSMLVPNALCGVASVILILAHDW
jgi:4-amino-4-deoxy-L-arabinose transferase-like glycosyltransferase